MTFSTGKFKFWIQVQSFDALDIFHNRGNGQPFFSIHNLVKTNIFKHYQADEYIY